MYPALTLEISLILTLVCTSQLTLSRNVPALDHPARVHRRSDTGTSFTELRACPTPGRVPLRSPS